MQNKKVTALEIKHRYTSAVLFTLEADSLEGANLEGANLEGANLPMHCRWLVSHSTNSQGHTTVKIGCKVKSIPGWDAWFAGTETYATPRGTDGFSRIHAMYLAIRTYLLTINPELLNTNTDAKNN